MRVRVNTASGSMYILDSIAMTWERVNKVPIKYYEGTNEGKLVIWPSITIGESMQFIDENPSFRFAAAAISTTQVVRAELI